jgi:hypothetical protein
MYQTVEQTAIWEVNAELIPRPSLLLQERVPRNKPEQLGIFRNLVVWAICEKMYLKISILT